MQNITIRSVTDDEYAAFATALVDGFSDDLPDDEFPDRLRSTLPSERTLAAFDGDQIVGTFGGYALDLTVPGGVLAMEGTTVVTVRATHRRRGLMQTMMRAHIDAAVARGDAIAGLWASESGIYGRFGYGPATHSDETVIDGTQVRFRPEVAVGSVRRIPVENAPELLSAVFDRVRTNTPGMFARTPEWWSVEVLGEEEWRRRGRTRLRAVVFDGPDGLDGYALYRLERGSSSDGHASGTVHIIEFIAATDDAHSALWSYLFHIDSRRLVKIENMPTNDPLPMKLVEPRRVRREQRFDALWLALLDVPAALEARTYERDGAVEFAIPDSFVDGVGGAYALTVTDGVGRCVRIDDSDGVSLDHDVLGALYLGGGDALGYAAAGRLRGSDDEVRLVHSLFATARPPWCNQVF